MRPAVLVHLLDEVPEHLLRHVEVGNHAVLERPDGADRPRRAAEHALGLDAHGVDLAGARVDRHHARLRQDDAAPAHVDERVRGPEIDRHVATAEAGEIGEEAHAPAGWTAAGFGGRAAGGSLSKPWCAEKCCKPAIRARARRRPATPDAPAGTGAQPPDRRTPNPAPGRSLVLDAAYGSSSGRSASRRASGSPTTLR